MSQGTGSDNETRSEDSRPTGKNRDDDKTATATSTSTSTEDEAEASLHDAFPFPLSLPMRYPYPWPYQTPFPLCLGPSGIGRDFGMVLINFKDMKKVEVREKSENWMKKEAWVGRIGPGAGAGAGAGEEIVMGEEKREDSEDERCDETPIRSRERSEEKGKKGEVLGDGRSRRSAVEEDEQEEKDDEQDAEDEKDQRKDEDEEDEDENENELHEQRRYQGIKVKTFTTRVRVTETSLNIEPLLKSL